MRIVAAMIAGMLSLMGGCAQLREAAKPGAQSAPREVSRETPREAQREAPREAVQSDAERMLAYFARLRRMSAADLTREREAARRAMAADASDEPRMRYAIALSVSVDGSVDAARAIELLDPVTRQRESPHQALAIVLRSLLAELNHAQVERAELQRKLDSLKALEKSLSGREGGR